MYNILIVEDDLALASGITYTLNAEGHQTTHANTLNKAIENISHTTYDLILLDVSLPDGLGYTLCETLRKNNNTTPIIFLTAMSDEMNVVQGLDLGADDYITKPFRVKELISRINAVMRRHASIQKNEEVIRFKDIVILPKQFKVLKDQVDVILTPSEYKLLLELYTNKNIVLERSILIEKLWDIDGSYVDDNTLSVYIKRLREKIEDDPQHPQMIQTVRGIGYSLKV